MNLKKLSKMTGCLVLSGALLLQTPGMVFAAERITDIKERQADSEMVTEGISETQTEKETEKPTEKPTETETQTETQTESHTESETTMPTETESESETAAVVQTETVKQTESETPTVTEPDTVGTTEETPETPGEKKGNKKIKGKNGLITIKRPKQAKEQEDHSDANANLLANIIAGNKIYLEQLSASYHLSFDEEFSEVMEEVEKDFCQWLEQPDEFQVQNWQDVLAVYVLRVQDGDSGKAIHLDAEAKEELEKIFFFMNVRRDSIITKKLSKEVDLEKEICSLDVHDYAELNSLDESGRKILEKYTGDECKRLCTIAAAAKGFVYGGTGSGVSDARAAIVAAACSLVGRVGYFWGGKSYAMGWDTRWGEPSKVTAGGSVSTGTTRGFGLDCSGFVCWTFYNALGGTDGGIGNHTTTQWNASEMVDGNEALPGDLVFYASPEAGDRNHVGVVVGRNSDGSLIVAHCSSSQNGVVIGEAWSSGFKYVRRPVFLK